MTCNDPKRPKINQNSPQTILWTYIVDALFHPLNPKFQQTPLYHLQMWDQQTHCYCLSTCLQKMKRWSLENPDHSPIVIMMEPKGLPGAEDSYTINNEIELSDILAVEQEILNVIGSDSLITPDSIRENNGKSLTESLKTRGWPSIYDMKGTFMFAWWDGDKIREKYETGTNGLKGRLIFTIKYVSDWAYMVFFF